MKPRTRALWGLVVGVFGSLVLVAILTAIIIAMAFSDFPKTIFWKIFIGVGLGLVFIRFVLDPGIVGIGMWMDYLKERSVDMKQRKY